MLYDELKKYISQSSDGNIAVAFSGGVDSGLLLKAACDAVKLSGKKVFAITAHTRLHPVKDLEIACAVAGECGAVHEIISIDELSEFDIEYNPEDRCYRCKKGIFSAVRKLASELGADCVLDGTNADDLKQYRPGIRALQELHIISPLADLDITKEEIRSMAEKQGISVADRPSTPCLATRIPYGEFLSYELMEKIAQGEEFLHNLGFYNVRLRAHGNIARIEIDMCDFNLIIANMKSITEKIKKLGFVYVTMDLEGFRSGSMDVNI